MDPSHPTTVFFSKLKKLAVTLETETAKLQHTFENRNNEADSGEWHTQTNTHVVHYVK